MNLARKITFARRSVAVAVLIAGQFCSPVLASQTVQAVDGPALVFLDREWGTRILDPNNDHAEYAIWVHLLAPEGLQLETLAFEGETLGDLTLGHMCQTILDNAEKFIPAGVDVYSIEHVDINFFIGEQNAYPHDITIFVEDKVCVDQFSVPVFDDRETKASKHSLLDENVSVLLNWGLEIRDIKWMISNKERLLEVQYEHRSHFERSVESLYASALCVMALASTDEYVKLFGVSYDVASFERMEIKIGSFRSVGFLNYSRSFGNASYRLSDGQCLEPIE